jgi:predicted short-subunit dehydrogenase-like oxidoreductase (DUF2520 family)
MVNVSIIGVGRIGGALALSLPVDQFSVEHLICRGKPECAESIREMLPEATVTTLDDLTEIRSDILFITTQDSEIVSVSKQIAPKLSSTPCVFHTSGALSSTVLDDLKTIGCKTGSMHPLVSISCAEAGPERFTGAYFCIEGQPEAVDMARQIATALGGIPFSIDTKFKTLYHAAAVTACGHLVALFDAAVEMMSKTGLSADDSKQILLPLVNSTVQNLSEQGTAAALTGTFARADTETFVEHLKTLNTNVSDDLLEIYLLLGERSLELAARQGVSPDRIDTMRAKVSIAKTKLKW